MFEKTDFTGDNVTRLQVVVMNLMGKHATTSFNDLMKHEQKKFNIYLNTYINALPENWNEKLTKDFNDACMEDIFNERFNAKNFPPAKIESNVILLPKEE